MKFSINWAQHYSNIDLKSWSADQVVSMIGSQLGAIEEVTAWGQRYDGIIISKIMSVKQHDNADTLHVCLIDDGGVAQNVTRNELGYVQVVCGAPNVSEGLIVAWITPGTVVPSSLDPNLLNLKCVKLEARQVTVC